MASEFAILRREWTICVAKTILYIQSEGYSCTLSEGFIGDTARHILKEVREELRYAGIPEITINRILARLDPTPHREDGGHLKGLGIDINIFKGDDWQEKGNEPIWPRVGKFWKSLHPKARWNPNDPNHLGFIHDGVY